MQFERRTSEHLKQDWKIITFQSRKTTLSMMKSKFIKIVLL